MFTFCAFTKSRLAYDIAVRYKDIEWIHTDKNPKINANINLNVSDKLKVGLLDKIMKNPWAICNFLDKTKSHYPNSIVSLKDTQK